MNIHTSIVKKIINNVAMQALLSLPTLGFGSVFQHFQQSTTSLSLAHADMAALAEDPSTAYYNPAGMARLCHSGFIMGVSSSSILSEFNGAVQFVNQSPSIGEFSTVASFLGANFTVNNALDRIVIKSARGEGYPTTGFLHLVFKVPTPLARSVDLTFGASLTNPWGYEMNYPCSTVNVYTNKTLFQSFAFSPSIGARFWNCLSIGVSAVLQQFKFDTFNNVMSSSADIKLSDWRWTWNIGVLYEFNARTRVGFVYKPDISYKMRGKLRFVDNVVDSRAHFTLPQSYSLGAYHRLNSCFDIMATLVYTTWNRFKPIHIYSDIQPIAAASLDYTDLVFTFDLSEYTIPIYLQDTLFIGFGGRYWVGNWQVRSGLAYDTNPIKNSKKRELSLPDQQRYHAAFGLGYRFNNCLSFDFGYQFIYLPKTEIGQSPLQGYTTQVNYSGGDTSPPFIIDDLNTVAYYTGSTASWAQVISAQIKWDF